MFLNTPLLRCCHSHALPRWLLDLFVVSAIVYHVTRFTPLVLVTSLPHTTTHTTFLLFDFFTDVVDPAWCGVIVTLSSLRSFDTTHRVAGTFLLRYLYVISIGTVVARFPARCDQFPPSPTHRWDTITPILHSYTYLVPFPLCGIVVGFAILIFTTTTTYMPCYYCRSTLHYRYVTCWI